MRMLIYYIFLLYIDKRRYASRCVHVAHVCMEEWQNYGWYVPLNKSELKQVIGGRAWNDAVQVEVGKNFFETLDIDSHDQHDDQDEHEHNSIQHTQKN